MRIHVPLLALCAICLTSVAAPRLTPAAPVDVTADYFAENEPSLDMSPDGQILAGSWNDWNYNDGCGFSYSTDGGQTWATRSFVPGMTSFSNDPNVAGTGAFSAAGDPAVAYNPKSGLFDIICQCFGTASGNQIQLRATTFNPAKANPTLNENLNYGAAAWSPSVAVVTGSANGNKKGSNGQFPDHESICIDSGTGAGHHFGRLFVAWAEFSGSGKSPIDISYSDDDGQTWTGPIRVSDAGHQFDQDARPQVGPDGTVYVTFINSKNENDLTHNVAMIGFSKDGGATWSKSYTVASLGTAVSGLLPNSNYRIFSDVVSAVDQNSGRVVVAFNDQRSGASQIYTCYQLTAGNMNGWSAAVPVKPSAREQFFPWLSSAPNGRVDLVFYDRSADPADTLNNVTLTSTTDSGAMWSSASLLPQGFDGDLYSACLAYVDPANCGNYFLGDYISVVSNNSKAQVLYTGNGPNSMDIFSVGVTVK